MSGQRHRAIAEPMHGLKAHLDAIEAGAASIVVHSQLDDQTTTP